MTGFHVYSTFVKICFYKNIINDLFVTNGIHYYSAPPLKYWLFIDSSARNLKSRRIKPLGTGWSLTQLCKRTNALAHFLCFKQCLRVRFITVDRRIDHDRKIWAESLHQKLGSTWPEAYAKFSKTKFSPFTTHSRRSCATESVFWTADDSLGTNLADASHIQIFSDNELN